MTPARLPFPTARLLFVIALAAAGLLVTWTIVRGTVGVEEGVYRGGVIGLIAATLAHVMGTLVGAALAAQKGALAAYMASTVVRFLLTPALAVSLYFSLSLPPKPVLVGAAVGYLLILAADIGTMLKAMQQHQGSTSA